MWRAAGDPDRMPVLADDDLLFEDDGAPATQTWAVYARVLRDWVVFLGAHGIGVFDGRARLKAALGAAYRVCTVAQDDDVGAGLRR